MWTAATGYIEVIARLIRSLSAIDKTASLVIGDEGVKVMVWDASHVLCGQLFLDTQLFATYDYDLEDAVDIKLSLQALVRCLQMFIDWRTPGNDESRQEPVTTANCFFKYSPEVGKFELHYAYDTMIANCKVNLIDDEFGFNSGIAFDVEEVMLQAIMPASILATTVRDLESVQTEQLGIRAVTSPHSQLELTSTSVLATSTFVLPNDPKVMEAFLVEGGDSQFVYDFSHFAKTRDALKSAKRVSLRYDSYGVLSLQCMYEVDSEKRAYLEFRILPLEPNATNRPTHAEPVERNAAAVYEEDLHVDYEGDSVPIETLVRNQGLGSDGEPDLFID